MSGRRLLTASIAMTALLGFGLTACGSSNKSTGGASSGPSASSGSAAAQPVKLGSTVTNMGTTDISASSAATLAIELHDNYFKPTFTSRPSPGRPSPST